MNEKIKISKKDVKFLRNALELDVDVVEKLVKVQEERQKKFQSKIDTSRQEALERYTAHIEALAKAKVEAVKRYEEEIQKYQQLVKNLAEQTKKVLPKPKKGRS